MRILRYFSRAYPWESLIVLECLPLAALVGGRAQAVGASSPDVA